MKLKNVIKTHFKKIPHAPNKKLYIYKCLYCNEEYTFHTTRLVDHLTSCRGCPQNVKNLVKEKPKRKSMKKRKKEEALSSSSDALNDSNKTVSCDNSINEKKNNNMKNFICKTSPNDQKFIEEKLALAIYCSGK